MTARTLQEIERDIITDIRATVPEPRLIDLGCGQAELQGGFVGVDYYAKGPRITHMDLYRGPWNFNDSSVDFFTSSHFVEHVPEWDLHFSEVWRCLKPGGHYRFIGPYAKSDRFLQDPTHRQPLTEARMMYLNQAWRQAQKIDHYGARVNFSIVGLGYSWNADFVEYMDGATEEARRHKLSHFWNIADDIFVILRKEELLHA